MFCYIFMKKICKYKSKNTITNKKKIYEVKSIFSYYERSDKSVNEI